jgi:predicted Na+-dependent transporter
MTLSDVVDVLNLTTLFPSILGGLIIGSVIFNIFKLSLNEIYAMTVSTIVFIFLMMTTQLTRPEAAMAGWEHWIGVLILYFLFIVSASIGKKCKWPALFLK